MYERTLCVFLYYAYETGLAGKGMAESEVGDEKVIGRKGLGRALMEPKASALPAVILPAMLLMSTEAAPLLLNLRSKSVPFTAASYILGYACV